MTSTSCSDLINGSKVFTICRISYDPEASSFIIVSNSTKMSASDPSTWTTGWSYSWIVSKKDFVTSYMHVEEHFRDQTVDFVIGEGVHQVCSDFEHFVNGCPFLANNTVRINTNDMGIPLQACVVHILFPQIPLDIAKDIVVERHMKQLGEAILDHFNVFNRIPYSNTHDTKAPVPIVGGTVFDVDTGPHVGPIVVFDIKAMYPSLVAEFCLCPTRLTSEDYAEQRSTGYTSEEHLLLIARRMQKDLAPKPVFTDVMERFLAYREAVADTSVKSLMKLAANSIIGIFGCPTSKYYMPLFANLVTTAGRALLLEVRSLTEKYGNVIAGDTDSVFLKLNYSEARDFTSHCNSGRSLCLSLQKAICKVGYNNIEIKIDAQFKTLIIFHKKSYIGELYDAREPSEKYVFKGVDIVRRDTPNVVRLLYSRIASLMLVNVANCGAVFVDQMKDQEAAFAEIKRLVESIDWDAHLKAKNLDYYVNGIRRTALLPNGDVDSRFYIEHKIVPAMANLLSVRIPKEEGLVRLALVLNIAQAFPYKRSFAMHNEHDTPEQLQALDLLREECASCYGTVADIMQDATTIDYYMCSLCGTQSMQPRIDAWNEYSCTECFANAPDFRPIYRLSSWSAFRKLQWHKDHGNHAAKRLLENKIGYFGVHLPSLFSIFSSNNEDEQPHHAQPQPTTNVVTRAPSSSESTEPVQPPTPHLRPVKHTARRWGFGV